METQPKHPTGSRHPEGFALIVVMMLMALLLVIGLGLLSLSSVSIRASRNENDQAAARANARMALMLAIGQLQETAGDDRRITGTAAVGGDPQTLVHPFWTGVWNSNSPGEPPMWLVSGAQPDPTQVLDDGNSIIFSPADPGDPASIALRAPWVEVDNPDGQGRYAYWIADEGVKAKVDVARPAVVPSVFQERLARSHSPLEPGMSYLGGDTWQPFTPGGGLDKKKLISMETVSLAALTTPALPREELPLRYLHDLTTGGYGLPVNVRDGGMKTDLSLLFDRSQQTKPYIRDYIGTPVVQIANYLSTGTPFLKFDGPMDDKNKFFLSKTISNQVPSGGGPNWGILFNYARVWQSSTGQVSKVFPPHPPLGTYLQGTRWLPYMRHDYGSALRRDVQHTNHTISPVVSTLQFGVLLGARPITPDDPDGVKRYQPVVHIKPIVGLWNPHNVGISPASYNLGWALLPYLQLRREKSGDEQVTEMWLRDYWKSATGAGSIPTDDGSAAGGFLDLNLTNISFQPGEFRLFSGEGSIDMKGMNNLLVPTLDPNGTFRIGVTQASGGSTALKVEEGTRLWFSDIYLQDTHWDGVTATHGVGTRAHLQEKYGGALDPEATAMWLSFKWVNKDGPPLQRLTGLWNGGQDSTAALPHIPEPVVARSSGGGPAKYLIEDLVAAPQHIATWRFQIRTSTEMEEPGQGLRGWVDSNPRMLAGQPRFDGSTSPSSGDRTGWNFSSPMMGGSHRLGALAGDGQGGNRGLIAEGGLGGQNIIPEGIPTPGRWQGLGGSGSTTTTGYPHVIAFDAPRAPLVSLGQFQHALLSRYNYEPSYVVGNSYADPRIPLDATSSSAFGFQIVDTSHEVNERLWDGFFFSTLAPDYLGVSSADFDGVFSFNSLASGISPLPNPRMTFSPLSGDTSLNGILESGGNRAPTTISSRIRVNGAFNVNSTSKNAWKAIFSTMGASELPVVNPATSALSWHSPGGVRFNRFSHSILNEPYRSEDGHTPGFWQGWRELSENELDRLAEEIVKEVRTRGPFRSMAEFVNRNPDSPDIAHQRKGALQAALDRVVNDALPADVALPASTPPGEDFSSAIDGENQAAGHAGYLMQGDVLQALAPILHVRSDYFRIRACGEAKDSTGKVVARAWCEAFVQRLPEFSDPTDSPSTAQDEISALNGMFGRRFQLVGFRWLSPSEVQ
jgi:type II secretory pathway pseudopilin PulG